MGSRLDSCATQNLLSVDTIKITATLPTKAFVEEENVRKEKTNGVLKISPLLILFYAHKKIILIEIVKTSSTVRFQRNWNAVVIIVNSNFDKS